MDGSLDTRRRQVRSAGIASITGWAMDLYDLTIILYLAATIGPLLFPNDNETLQLAWVYASFAVTLLFRPLGSAIFGAYADRMGRKRAMLVAIVGVGVSTALMGAVPTYEAVGFAAPVIFLLLRITQGVFVGGVVASTHTLGTETVSPQHRGLMSGLVAGGGAGAGAVVASVVYFIVSWAVPAGDFDSYGWRIMFFTGLATAAFSFYVYRRTEESPLWKDQQTRLGESRTGTAATSPLRQLMSARYRGIALLNIAIAAGGATTYYLTVGFFPTFYGQNLGIPATTAAVILVLANIGVIVGGAWGGHLSDRYGRRTIFLAFGVPNLILLPGLYLWMNSMDSGSVPAVSAISVVMAVSMMCAAAPILIYLNERFPTEIRATGTSLCWNIGFAIGGIMPAVVSAVSPSIDGIPVRLAIGIAIAVVVFIVGSLLTGETRHLGLGERLTSRGQSTVDDTTAPAAARANLAAPSNESSL